MLLQAKGRDKSSKGGVEMTLFPTQAIISSTQNNYITGIELSIQYHNFWSASSAGKQPLWTEYLEYSDRVLYGQSISPGPISRCSERVSMQTEPTSARILQGKQINANW